MKIDVFFYAGEPAALEIMGCTVVIIDVLRTTSTIVESLVNGARGVYPTSSAEEATKLAASLGRDDTLLCGESKGMMIEGFDLGNSPREFVKDRVAGKRLVMSTTNGTWPFLMAKDSHSTFACCLMNISAVAYTVAEAEHLVVVCAGEEGKLSMDDAVCAGILIDRIQEKNKDNIELNDAGYAALELSYRVNVDTEFLAMTASGKNLIEMGFDDDLKHCAQIDCYPVVPEMTDLGLHLQPISRKISKENL